MRWGFRLRAPAFVLLASVFASPAGCANRAEDPELLSQALFPAIIAGQPQSVLVIGDSLTDFSDGFGLDALLPPLYATAHRGVINTDFNYWTGRLDSALDEATAGPPNHVLVPLGTNDGFFHTEDAFIEYVYGFHAELRRRSQARVYYFLMPGTLIDSLAPQIARNNTALAASYPRDNTRLVDLAGRFAAAPEQPALYAADDPLHPTEAGYRLMGQIMREALTAP